MREDAVKIKACADLLHGQESGEDRDANKVARKKAEDEIIKAEEHRRFQRELEETRKLDMVLDWLSSKSLNNQCFARQEKNLRGRSPITCKWLFSHKEFVQWQNIPSPSPILWIHGPPGSGKSTLCSSAIEFLAKNSGSDAVVFHFYDFAQHLSPEQTLSILAAQLLQCRQGLQKIPDKLQKIIHAPESLLERVQNVTKALIEGYSRVYFFLDGLDEETTTKSSWDDAVLVLRFLAKLVDDSPTRVRVWCSSQRRDRISKELQGCRSLDIDSYARNDLTSYLSEEVSKLQWSSSSDQACILKTLQSRAECSFIWAKLMIDGLRDCWSTARMEEYLTGLPKTLSDYYRRFFERMEKVWRPLAWYVGHLLYDKCLQC
jgi:ABC-type dipeptide/oligopeptide/nickel transport system ATPase subunit